MKNITIRECAINACLEANGGSSLLIAICKRAIDGEPIDWDSEGLRYYSNLKPLYAAIAPDILESVCDEPTEEEIADEMAEVIMDAIGDFMGEGGPKLTVIGRVSEAPEGED